MLPEIGLMMGVYIITRMVSFLSRTGDRSESVVAKVFSAITILVTLFVILDLLSRGSSPSQITR